MYSWNNETCSNYSEKGRGEGIQEKDGHIIRYIVTTLVNVTIYPRNSKHTLINK
jgi:hypothetical protein